MEYLFGEDENIDCLFCCRTAIKKSCTGRELVTFTPVFRRDEYHCPYCGVYSFGSGSYQTHTTKTVQALCYFMLNEKSPNTDIVVVSDNDVSVIQDECDRTVQYISNEDILSYYPESFSEQVNKALLNLSRVYPEYDSRIFLKISGGHDDIFKFMCNANRTKNLVFIDSEISKEAFAKNSVRVFSKLTSFLDLMTDMQYLFRSGNGGDIYYTISS